MTAVSRWQRLRRLLRGNRFVYLAYGLCRRLWFNVSLSVENLRFKFEGQTGSIPVPPPRLRFWVHGALDKQSFLSGGYAAYKNYDAIISKFAPKPQSLRLLDVGCGCARVMRHFFERFESNGKTGFEFHGIDVDSDSIDWVLKNLPDFGTWSVNSPQPPIDYPDHHFDVILCNSVFTHLNEKLQFTWLAEVGRLLSQRGIAIVSIHGDSVWRSLATVPDLTHNMEEAGFHFHRNHVGIRNYLGFPDFYHTAFHSKHYIMQQWSQYFDIVAYIEKGVGDHQDIVVLRQIR